MLRNKQMGAFLSLKASIKRGYDTVLKGKSSKEAAVQSSSPSNNCEQNIIAIDDTVNVTYVVKREEWYSRSQGKPANKDTVKS